MTMAHSTPQFPQAQSPAENAHIADAGKLAVVDGDGGQPLEAAQSAKPAPRRRGRPPGARTKVAHDNNATADEFAMLRAVAQGVDLTVAARQYLLWPGRAPERPALIKKYQELLDRIEAAAHGIAQSQEARAMVRVLRDHQTIVIEEPRGLAGEPGALKPTAVRPGDAMTAMSAPVAAQAPKPPTLEEFAAQFDEDMFSEAELIEQYETLLRETAAALPDPAAAPAPKQAEIALPPEASTTVLPAEPAHLLTEARSAAERMANVLQAINWLDEHLGTKPERAHRVEQWVIMSTAQREVMGKAGVITLGNLVDWISLKGESWFDHIPGYGAKRANNLLAWIQRWNLAPSAGLSRLPGLALARELQVEVTSVLVPLDKMIWPAELDGKYGAFRTRVANTMKANNDREAVSAWFKSIKEKSPHTQEAYRRAIERLILWAVHVRRQTLSSLAEEDFFDFKEFLIDPPEDWVQQTKGSAHKETPQWRPLRGPLNSQSLNVTFAAIRSMFTHWVKAKYITANASLAVHGQKRDEETMDVFRSFTEADLQVVGATFADLPEGPSKRRLRALFRLIENAGLRRAEVAQARWSHVQTDRELEHGTESRVLEVLGKGKRKRRVPLNAATMEALREHRADREELLAQGKLSLFKQVKPADQPLIGVLDDRWISAKDKKLAIKRADQAVRRNAALPTIEIEREAQAGMLKYTVNEHGALSSHMLYHILKGFFAMCSVAAGERSGEADGPFMRASTHWLRHTYAHKALVATRGDLSIVKELMGHKNINTTAIYVKANMKDRINAVDQLKTSV
ncbi:MAG: hypothetical protein EOO27_03635 [Comamonadaceae bacterium]|nr:MAG: hypothetical protein EOO27_03635 [Comamonadaceae bacterium]